MPAHGCAFYVREPGADDEPERVPETQPHEAALLRRVVAPPVPLHEPLREASRRPAIRVAQSMPAGVKEPASFPGRGIGSTSSGTLGQGWGGWAGSRT